MNYHKRLAVHTHYESNMSRCHPALYVLRRCLCCFDTLKSLATIATQGSESEFQLEMVSPQTLRISFNDFKDLINMIHGTEQVLQLGTDDTYQHITPVFNDFIRSYRYVEEGNQKVYQCAQDHFLNCFMSQRDSFRRLFAVMNESDSPQIRHQHIWLTFALKKHLNQEQFQDLLGFQSPPISVSTTARSFVDSSFIPQDLFDTLRQAETLIRPPRLTVLHGRFRAHFESLIPEDETLHLSQEEAYAINLDRLKRTYNEFKEEMDAFIVELAPFQYNQEITLWFQHLKTFSEL